MIYGQRGTNDLIPEQRPRRRKMRGRAQPYRAIDRPLGPTLDAMLKGGPVYGRNPADFRNRQAKRFAQMYGRGR